MSIGLNSAYRSVQRYSAAATFRASGNYSTRLPAARDLAGNLATRARAFSRLKGEINIKGAEMERAVGGIRTGLDQLPFTSDRDSLVRLSELEARIRPIQTQIEVLERLQPWSERVGRLVESVRLKANSLHHLNERSGAEPTRALSRKLYQAAEKAVPEGFDRSQPMQGLQDAVNVVLAFRINRMIRLTKMDDQQAAELETVLTVAESGIATLFEYDGYLSLENELEQRKRGFEQTLRSSPPPRLGNQCSHALATLKPIIARFPGGLKPQQTQEAANRALIAGIRKDLNEHYETHGMH